MDLLPLGVAVDDLAATSPADLAVVQLQALVAAARSAADRLQGIASRALGELSARTGGTVVDEAGRRSSVLGWLRDETASTGCAAGAAVRVAALLRDLPVLADAVADGRLGIEQARVLTRLHGRVDLVQLQRSQAELLEVARGRDATSLGQYVRHLVATHCEPAPEAEQAQARARRYLQMTDQADGTVRGRFVLASEDAEAVRTLLEPLARRAGLDDERSVGQRRADALVEACELALRFAHLPVAGGRRPQLSYVVAAGWAAGCTCRRANGVRMAPGGRLGADGPGLSLSDSSSRCATAAWTGPQTRGRVEALLCDARVSRVLLGPAGQVHSLESLTDQVTPAQRRALAARDRGCAARGCTRPPAFCDAHHLLARADGGTTDLGNLVLLCRRHHVRWHDGRLDVHQLRVPWLVPRSGAGSGP